ncbi:restriction endonuclease subunit S [Staphylococcus aureus]|nr:restriction endonuclease subunit S [Staphylococcus aureus]MBH4567526.1 restriction endonuclease subunit S [Staphylococcus aureus]
MSNTQTKNVPELRFPGFEGEWEEKKLEDIIKVNSGKDYKHLDKGDIPVYGTGGYMTSVSEPLSEIDAVGIGRKGTINKPYLLEAPFWTVDTLFYCTPKKETDILFILSLFRKINWKVYDESTGVPSLSKQTINKINRFVPTNKEQQKIGKFFSKLDRQIELEEQKIESLQQQKKGYLQKIFSQELRFKDENGNDYPDWEEKQLGDTLEFIKDGTHGTHENVDNGPWLLSAKNIKNNKIIISSDDRKISENDYKKIYKNYKLERGDLLLTIVGTIGRTAIVKDPNSIAFQRSVAILKTKALYDVGFIFQLFQTNYFKNLLLRKQVVSAQPGLYLGDIRKLKISISNISEEQKKIGSFFSKFDRQIELEQQKLELLQQQKKGLLQSMFI